MAQSTPPIAVPAVRRILDGLYFAFGVIAGAFLVTIAGLMMLLSLGRHIGINIRGADEITAWLMAASAFLGLAFTFKQGDLVRVGLLIERLSGRPRRVMEIVALAVASVFLGAFAWNAVVMVWESWVFGEYVQGALAVPIWIPQSGLALGAVLLFVAVVDELVRVLRGARPAYERERPTTLTS